MFEIPQPVETEVLKQGISFVIEKLRNKRGADRSFKTEDLDAHLREVMKWCTKTQFLGLSNANAESGKSIGLSFYDVPRSFRSKFERKRIRKETVLLRESSHHLIVGDPGCGKTTTLKRLAHQLLTHDRNSKELDLEFPVVVLCRDIKEDRSIFLELADRFGLTKLIETNTEGEATINGKELNAAVIQLVNELNPLILIDGLDEVPINRFQSVLSDLVKLGNLVTSGKVIVTCRTGSYSKQLENFELLEILPLDHKQIEKVAQIWLRDTEPFFRALDNLPYADVTERPLLLTQLLFIFKYQGYLPDQPASVYRRMLLLLLEVWDRDRGVHRISKYAQFEPERKLDFLSEFSYLITVDIKRKSFTQAQLLRVYDRMYTSFALPSHEAEQVANEIESHNGIIVAAGFDRYEFCHLSIQEYLCAYYIIRNPLAVLTRYLSTYPSPVAVAVALSSDPANLLCELVRQMESGEYRMNEWVASVFTSRFLIERPVLRPSLEVGIALLILLFPNNVGDRDFLKDALKVFGLKESLAQALSFYWINMDESDIASELPESFYSVDSNDSKQKKREVYYLQLKDSIDYKGDLEPPYFFLGTAP